MAHEFFKRKTPEQRQDQTPPQELGATAVRYATEHSRSIEDGEKYQALEVLRELGVLVPLTDMDTYHGRAGSKGSGEPWRVNPHFKNGGNDSGNRNVYGAPVLYTSNYKNAVDFARARSFRDYHDRGNGDLLGYYRLSDDEKRQYLKEVYEDVEVYDIMARDTDASVISNRFSFQDLSNDDQARYHESMKQLLIGVPLAEGIPLPLDTHMDRKSIDSVMNQFSHTPGVFKDNASMERIAAVTGVNPEDVRAIAAVYNARNYIWQSPSRAANLIQDTSSGVVGQVDENNRPFTVSVDYIARFFNESHIVGRESMVSSATLGKDISIISLFNLHKVNPAEHYEQERQYASKALLPIARSLEARLPRFDSGRNSLFDTLDDVHVSPRKLVESAKGQPRFKKLFEADLGNWEGYTLEEHTETVLRNFDENFMDSVPAELLTPMRLAMITHDIGKPIASSRGEKHRQGVYNKAAADRFFQTIGLDSTVGNFLKNMTNKGMSLAAESAVFGRDQYLPELRSFAANELRKIMGDVTEETIDGYIDMCEMLVTCDGGAYTQMAVTRKPHGIYRNHKSFDSSFIEPAGPGKRDLRLKNAGIAKRSRK